MKIRNWRKWQYRRYTVSHGRDGFRLNAQDRHVFDAALSIGLTRILTMLGDPCCGKGPLSKFKLSFNSLNKLGVTRYNWILEPDEDDTEVDNEDRPADPSEDAMDMIWFDILQLTCRLYYLNTDVLSIPLTDDQARTIRPSVDTWFGRDEDDDNACCVTAALLNDRDFIDRDWHSYGCENFQGHTLEQ